ncbi:hypothetical protein [Cryptosporangium sp. NPDC051539]|uniref:hypothetical protein n=1 Tax=Cryptosporangium sp. NPDC051539 TaxID=3363962 RepID=UPI003795D061
MRPPTRSGVAIGGGRSGGRSGVAVGGGDRVRTWSTGRSGVLSSARQRGSCRK